MVCYRRGAYCRCSNVDRCRKTCYSGRGCPDQGQLDGSDTSVMSSVTIEPCSLREGDGWCWRIGTDYSSGSEGGRGTCSYWCESAGVGGVVVRDRGLD